MMLIINHSNNNNLTFFIFVSDRVPIPKLSVTFVPILKFARDFKIIKNLCFLILKIFSNAKIEMTKMKSLKKYLYRNNFNF